MNKNLIAIILSFIFVNLHAQGPTQWKSGEIYNALKKLNFLGSALYVAAHPDDENTRMISYLSNETKARTAYLSLTRGDGGQNLIGPEIRELLGVIRTQELLAARRIDGGEQLFSRANDFGFSKNPTETLEIWDEDKVMADAIWAIRTFKPDVIINRFDHNSAGRTHGHHTASAMIGYEAFDKAADPNVNPEQFEYTEPHQADRLFFNTSWWFYGSREAFAKADKSDMISVDIGTYYPILGKSNSEIAAESRSQHKCQGMGNTGSRGSQMEYLQLLKGNMPSQDGEVFSGINTTWSRVPGGDHITSMIEEVINAYDFTNPSQSVPGLIKVMKEIKNLPDHHWKEVKLKEIKTIIQAAMGIYAEVVTTEHMTTSRAEMPVRIEITNRSQIPLTATKLIVPNTDLDTTFASSLSMNEGINYRDTMMLDDLPLSAPYWLLEEGSLGMYKVDDQQKIGKPESDPSLKAVFSFEIEGEMMELTLPVRYKYNSPEDGPIYRPLEIVPEVTVTMPDKVQLFKNGMTKTILVEVTAGRNNVQGELAINLPTDWQVLPATKSFSIEQKGASQLVEFQVTSPATTSEEIATLTASVGENEYHYEMVKIEYDHIPFQTVLLPSKAKFVNVDIEIAGKNIGYIMGAGDDIPTSMSQIGYQVDLLDIEAVTADNLAPYDAVIMGVRAYNKWDALRFKQKELLQYCEQGGTLVLQYNTSFRLKTNELAPYSLKLSRSRVTKEEAPITILAPEHPVLNYPNKITQEDFDGWVQERGLYFPGEWSDDFTAILSSQDPGEDALEGGLLVAPYGDGWYVYTSYSWFRELPAGVAGAYRIFANICGLGNTPRP